MSIKKKFYTIKDLEEKYGPLTFADFLKSWRLCDEYSQTEFAKKLSISKANLCDLEKGRKHVSLERAVKIANILGLSPQFLVQLTLQDMLRDSKLDYKIEVKAA